MAWTEGAIVILQVWIILWANAAVVPELEPVVIDLVWHSVGRLTRKVMRIAGLLLVGGLALCAIPAYWDYVHFMDREGTPVLGMSFMRVFLPYVLLLALDVRAALAIRNAFRGVGLEADLRL